MNSNLLFALVSARNDTIGAYRPTSGTGSLSSVEIRCTVPEIFARERKRVRSAGNRVVVGEVRETTTISLSTRMNSGYASQIRLRSDSRVLRNALKDGHTDRQTDRFHSCFREVCTFIWQFCLGCFSQIGSTFVFNTLDH